MDKYMRISPYGQCDGNLTRGRPMTICQLPNLFIDIFATPLEYVS